MLTCIIDGVDIYQADYMGNRRLTGKTQRTYEEVEGTTKQYYDKLVELGVIVPQKTAEEMMGGWNRSGDCGNGFTCNRVSNCEVEKQEIIDSARTQYQIEQQGAATRAAVSAGTEAITAQNNRLYIQGLQEKMFDLKMENQGLKGQLYADAKFSALTAQVESCCCGFNRRLDGIEANMLTRPQLSGVAATCSGQIIPAHFGGYCGNGWNNGCCNNNI